MLNQYSQSTNEQTNEQAESHEVTAEGGEQDSTHFYLADNTEQTNRVTLVHACMFGI